MAPFPQPSSHHPLAPTHTTPSPLLTPPLTPPHTTPSPLLNKPAGFICLTLRACVTMLFTILLQVICYFSWQILILNHMLHSASGMDLLHSVSTTVHISKHCLSKLPILNILKFLTPPVTSQLVSNTYHT